MTGEDIRIRLAHLADLGVDTEPVTLLWPATMAGLDEPEDALCQSGPNDRNAIPHGRMRELLAAELDEIAPDDEAER